jgi:hypothetical protein
MPSPVKQRSTKKVAGLVPVTQTESEIVADSIVARYSDLTLSVTHIMRASLSETDRLHAITVFQASLACLTTRCAAPERCAASRMISADLGWRWRQPRAALSCERAARFASGIPVNQDLRQRTFERCGEIDARDLLDLCP